ncbi:DUF2927 domain-containing protein [Limibaculum sp. FT325]|uniref:DUF2927 domain-containing protein n=1 Tax=Thermohalobaculum sediminis TaxID=2939436 RepID=UPI0020BF0ADC|nr:DUF2927 domain-containing protein [Limibaculum sediminis]MCL5776751.1 DUF2927 domain-containing protein [Limibaculum sediminis]
MSSIWLSDPRPLRHDAGTSVVARRALSVAALCLGLAACAGQPSSSAYREYELALTAIGDLRTDTAPDDAPFTNADLVRNFSRIALRHEVDIEKAGDDSNSAPNPLQRWEGPIRWGLYGRGATPADHAEVERYLAHISEITGIEMEEVERDVNLMILITDPAERPAFSAALRRLYPALADGFDTWRSSGRVVCMASNLFSAMEDDVIVFGMVVIGSEVTGLLRRSCIHEEIAQALGLGNDHPEVRPSIFNDDEEFALLTEHDEWLLRILYDQRLAPGMTEEEAIPVVREIVEEIRPGPDGDGI